MSAADRILWYKAWTETRLFFGPGLAFLMASALALYAGYPDDYTARFPNGAINPSGTLPIGATAMWRV